MKSDKMDEIIYNAFISIYCHLSFIKWLIYGKPIPPPHRFKQQVVEDYAKRFHLDTLIETGTYKGDMVLAMRNKFVKIFSIELDDTLYNRAKNKFASSKNVHICKGDSSILLKAILISINRPCLFWLDAHYSGGITAKGELESPITQELEVIFAQNIDHVILIDDARLFTGSNDYPTIDNLRKIICSYRKDYDIIIDKDIIRIFKIG